MRTCPSILSRTAWAGICASSLGSTLCRPPPYVGSFGVMGWVAGAQYAKSQCDPLAEHKSGIMRHMNADHKDALILLAKRFAGIEAQEAEMTSIDRLGFHLRLKTQDG